VAARRHYALSKIMNFVLSTFVRDERGATSGEYAMLLVLVGCALIAASFALATVESGSLRGAADLIARSAR
jgi:Flp pilus assembly pilin Flp